MKKTTLLLSFIVCALFASAQTNLVVNPGFETWTDASTPAPNWTALPVASQSFSQETTIVHSGTYSLLSTHTGTTGTAKMITKPYITVTAGKTYTFSFWYYADASTSNLTGALRMWGYWENPDGSNGTFDQTGLQPTAFIDVTSAVGKWVQFTADVTAPTGSGMVELDIRFYKGAKVYVDDVSFVEKTASAVNQISADQLNVSVNNNQLIIKDAPSNKVEIFNTLGAKVLSKELVNGSVDLNLEKGIYIVRSGKAKAKIIL